MSLWLCLRKPVWSCFSPTGFLRNKMCVPQFGYLFLLLLFLLLNQEPLGVVCPKWNLCGLSAGAYNRQCGRGNQWEVIQGCSTFLLPLRMTSVCITRQGHWSCCIANERLIGFRSAEAWLSAASFISKSTNKCLHITRQRAHSLTLSM